MVNLAGGRPGGTQDHFIDGHTHVQELRHYVEHVFHAGVHAADVEVGGDGIGTEALAYGGNRLAEEKAAAAVTDVEDDAAASGF